MQSRRSAERPVVSLQYAARRRTQGPASQRTMTLFRVQQKPVTAAKQSSGSGLAVSTALLFPRAESILANARPAPIAASLWQMSRSDPIDSASSHIHLSRVLFWRRCGTSMTSGPAHMLKYTRFPFIANYSHNPIVFTLTMTTFFVARPLQASSSINKRFAIIPRHNHTPTKCAFLICPSPPQSRFQVPEPKHR